MIKEIWKDIKDYKGLYKVSNLGRVKSLYRIDSNKHPVKERILKSFTNTWGYEEVLLCNKSISIRPQHHTIHRLVAEAFVPNPDGKVEINHIDENKNNNCYNNLCWVSKIENINYGTRNDRVAKKLAIPVIGTNIITGEVVKFKSAMEASRNGFRQGCISKCIKKTAITTQWLHMGSRYGD